jgi:hypothetical protein
MKTENPPDLNASHPNEEAEADPNPGILASKSKAEMTKKKETKGGLAVGNKEKANKDTTGLALAPGIEPDVQEHEAEPTRSLSRRWKLTIAMLVLFVIGIVVTFSIVFSRKRSSPGVPPTTIQDKPTAPPTAPPTATSPPTTTAPPTAPPTMSRFSILEDVIGSSFEDDFPNSTLQEEALDWLVDEDPAYLAVDTDSTTLLERYTAAHFYFAMKGSLWTYDNRWLSKEPVCLWEGLNCTDEGFLVMMILGTCLLACFCL